MIAFANAPDFAFRAGDKVTRERIYTAAFSLAVSLSNFVTASRRWKSWSQVAFEQQPALFMSQVQEVSFDAGTSVSPTGMAGHIRGIPIRWQLFLDFSIYVNVGQDPDTSPSTALNPILDAFDEAFPQPDPKGGRGPQTLGGLVSEARIYGVTKLDEGTQLSQGFAIVPVRIVTI